MRLMVDGGSYLAAATALRSANQLAALQHDALAGRLAAYGGMAGNDATSLEFAQTYDGAAAEALAATADLSTAFIGLGRLTSASVHHHAQAEDNAAAPFAVSAYTGGDLHEGDYVRVSPATPPSAVGAQEPSLGTVDRFILDHVEGFVWPGADVDRLRAAATTWRRAAADTDGLLDHCRSAAGHLDTQRSPEIPMALDTLAELRLLIGDLADQQSALAQACEEYSAQVEAAHARTRALLAEVAQMVVEGMVVSAAVGLITGGTATAAVAGATLARVAAQAPRFHAILQTLRGAAATLAVRLRHAQDGAVVVRGRLEKFLRLDLRNERGAMRLPGRGGHPPASSARPAPSSPSLRHHDELGGHAFDRHVGKSRAYLWGRIEDGLPRASTFRSELEADEAVGEALRMRGTTLDEWLASGRRQQVLRVDLGRVTGVSMDATGRLAEVTGVRVVLRRYESDWRIHTAYPEPV